MSSINATSHAEAGDDGGEAAALHPDIIQFHILTKLDGSTLAAASCVSNQLLSLTSDDRLWRDICNSTWPSTAHPSFPTAICSFAGGHRAFYSDAFLATRCDHFIPPPSEPRYPATSKLISAVDIFYDDRPIYSKLLTTETLSSPFMSSPFRLDLFHQGESVAAPLNYDGDGGKCMGCAAERLRVSWTLIDPSRGRAVRVASARAVDARWQILSEEMQLRYATVVGGGGGELVQMYVLVTCGGKHGGVVDVREVVLQFEDTDWRMLTGSEVVGVVDAAMGGRRLKADGGREKDAYEMFVMKSVEFRGAEPKRERRFEVAFKAAGVFIFMAIWSFFLSG